MIIGLVMQTPRQLPAGLRSPDPARAARAHVRQGHGDPEPDLHPEGQAAMEALARRLAEATGDYAAAGGSWFEVFDVPMTAHFLGGVPIGSTPERGVVDAYHRRVGAPRHLRRRRRRRSPRTSASTRR